MASYLLYLPNRRGADPGHLEAVGLGELGPGYMCRDVLQNGPDGGGGLLAYWDNPAAPESNPVPTVDTERQTWLAEPGAEKPRWWLIFETARPPGPEDLLRPQPHAGTPVILEDQNGWTVPTAVLLPKLLGAGGRSKIKPLYQPFWAATMRVLETFLVLDELGRPFWSFSNSDGFGFCCQALALNYRLTPEIVELLELVETRHLIPILDAVVEGELMRAVSELLEKKSAASGPVSTPAGPGSAPGGSA